LIQPEDADSGNQKQYFEGIYKMMELSTFIEYNNAEPLEMGKNRSRSWIRERLCVCIAAGVLKSRVPGRPGY